MIHPHTGGMILLPFYQVWQQVDGATCK